MPHPSNRAAFLAARGTGHPLLMAYSSLVVTELALKDHSGNWHMRHDIPQLLGTLGDPGLVALGAALRSKLAAIPCTAINGLPATVPGNSYPSIRYARLVADHAGGVTDAAIGDLILLVDDIITRLRAKGVSI